MPEHPQRACKPGCPKECDPPDRSTAVSGGGEYPGGTRSWSIRKGCTAAPLHACSCRQSAHTQSHLCARAYPQACSEGDALAPDRLRKHTTGYSGALTPSRERLTPAVLSSPPPERPPLWGRCRGYHKCPHLNYVLQKPYRGAHPLSVCALPRSQCHRSVSSMRTGVASCYTARGMESHMCALICSLALQLSQAVAVSVRVAGIVSRRSCVCVCVCAHAEPRSPACTHCAHHNN